MILACQYMSIHPSEKTTEEVGFYLQCSLTSPSKFLSCLLMLFPTSCRQIKHVFYSLFIQSCSLSLYEVDSRPHNCVCLFFYSNPSKKRGRMKECTREKEGRKRGRGKEGRMVLKISVWC